MRLGRHPFTIGAALRFELRRFRKQVCTNQIAPQAAREAQLPSKQLGCFSVSFIGTQTQSCR